MSSAILVDSRPVESESAASCATRRSRWRSIPTSVRCAVGEHGGELPLGADDDVVPADRAASNATSDLAGCGGRSDTPRLLVDRRDPARRGAGTSTPSTGSSTADGGPGRREAWAAAHGLDTDRVPDASRRSTSSAQPPEVDRCDPDDPDPAPTATSTRPGSTAAGATSIDRLATWAQLALEVYRLQREQVERLDDRPAALATARSESAAALLAVELGHDGLPIDVAEAERIIASFIGPRPDRRRRRAPTGGRTRRPRAHALCPPICAAASTCATRPTSSRCCGAPVSKSTTPGPGGSNGCATSTPSSTRCSAGARRNGWRRPSGIAGSTSTSAPTAAYAARGRRRTVPPVG